MKKLKLTRKPSTTRKRRIRRHILMRMNHKETISTGWDTSKTIINYWTSILPIRVLAHRLCNNSIRLCNKSRSYQLVHPTSGKVVIHKILTTKAASSSLTQSLWVIMTLWSLPRASFRKPLAHIVPPPLETVVKRNWVFTFTTTLKIKMLQAWPTSKAFIMHKLMGPTTTDRLSS